MTAKPSQAKPSQAKPSQANQGVMVQPVDVVPVTGHARGDALRLVPSRWPAAGHLWQRIGCAFEVVPVVEAMPVHEVMQVPEAPTPGCASSFSSFRNSFDAPVGQAVQTAAHGLHYDAEARAVAAAVGEVDVATKRYIDGLAP